MSENLDLVRSIYTAWEFSSTYWAHSEIEYVMGEGPSPGSWRGVPAMNEAWRDFLGSWEDNHAKVEGYRELDAERALVLVHESGRARRADWALGSCARMGRTCFTSAATR